MDSTLRLERLVGHLTERGVAPGTRLPAERTLARELGMSRPALREATRALIGLGLLEPRTGSGTYLADIALDELMVVRTRLEPLAAALAAERASDGEAEGLRALLGRMVNTVDDPVAFADADLTLHSAIATASGNPFLVGSLAGLTLALRLSRARTVQDRERRGASLDELERLVRAIERRQADEAASAMLAHLGGVTSTLRELAGDEGNGPAATRAPAPSG